MKDIVIATRNPGKFFEIQEALKDCSYKLLFLGDLEIEGDVDESGDTFEDNARKKAKFFYELIGRPVVAEDSGLLVNALPGELGVKTRRWGKGENASDEEWIGHFLERMESVPENERGAKFVCCAVYYDGVKFYSFFGETEGIITASLEAPIKRGLPLSSCFMPKGHGRVYAAMTAQEKITLSHRGAAIHALGEFLEKTSF